MRWRAGGACLVAVSLLAASCSGGSPATAPVDDGPPLVEVPSVIGDNVEFASGRLSAIGSPAIVEPVDGLLGDPNVVVEQLPLPGSSVVVGSPVVLKVPGGSPTPARDLTEPSAEPTTTTTQPPTTTATTTTTTQAPTTTVTTATTTTTQAPASTTTTTTTQAPASTTTTTTTQAPASTTTTQAPATTTTTTAPCTETADWYRWTPYQIGGREVIDLGVTSSGASATATWTLPDDLEVVAVILWVPGGQNPVDRPEYGDQLPVGILSHGGGGYDHLHAHGYRASLMELDYVDRFLTSYTVSGLTTRQGVRFEIITKDLASCPTSLGAHSWSDPFDISVENDGWGPIVDMTKPPPAVVSRGDTVTVEYRIRDLSGVETVCYNYGAVRPSCLSMYEGSRPILWDDDFTVQSTFTGTSVDKTASYTFEVPSSPDYPCGDWNFYFQAWDSSTDPHSNFGTGVKTTHKLLDSLYVSCS